MKDKGNLENENESMKKKIMEDEKRILNLIAEFEKLNDYSNKQEEEILNKDTIIFDLQTKLNEKNRYSVRSFNGKNSDVLSEKNKESEKVQFISIFINIYIVKKRIKSKT